ncbi:MAG: hypothetical protein KBT35_05115 [Firmicutes bacterium]|nr:hypothetical protein [Candidatus Colivicinus equi]
MKKIISKICKVISVLLVIAFVALSIIDYINYNPMYTSAPYYVNLLVNALLLLIPSSIAFLIGIIIEKRH